MPTVPVDAFSRQDLTVEATPVVDSTFTLAIQWIGRRQGKFLEIARIHRAITEMSEARHDGVPLDWRDWVTEVGRSLGLHLRARDCGPEDLAALLATGHAAIGYDENGRELIGLSKARGRRIQALQFSDLRTRVIAGHERRSWSIVVDEPEHAASHHHHEASPLLHLWNLLKLEQKDLLAAVAIAAVAGLLLLSVPVTAQQLVRTVTFANLYQPIVVLSAVLLGLLGFVASLQLLHIYVAELIQRRLFVRVAAQVAQHLPHVSPTAQREHYLPELMNRFLDVGIIQKTLASMIVDGVGIVLTTVIGMTVMAFYHPFLLGYDLLLLFCLTVIIFLLGRGGIQTAIEESRSKYEMAAWLQQLSANCSVARAYNLLEYVAEYTDTLVVRYLKHRKSHFRVLLRQIIAVLAMQALATTALLGLGGYLVLNEQLTLGQLVAAELIVATIVASFAKLAKHIENWYDLLAAVEKVSHLTEPEVIEATGHIGVPRGGAAQLVLSHADPAEAISNQHDGQPADGNAHTIHSIQVEPGQFKLLHNWSNEDRLSLLMAFKNPSESDNWKITIDGWELQELRPESRGAHVLVLDQATVFPGTVAENVHLHRYNVTDREVHRILHEIGLADDLERLELGLDDPLLPNGFPLSPQQLQKVQLARALAGQPGLVVADNWFDPLGDDELLELVPKLKSLAPQTTWLILTSQRRIVEAFSQDRATASSTGNA